MLSWGDVGMYLVTPGGGLGAAAVQAAGTPEQKARFLARFMEEKPTLGAMCMTEAGAGSDTASIRTRAVLDEKTNEWVINGEKIFYLGRKAFTEYEKFGKGFWSSGRRSIHRLTCGMRAFVVNQAHLRTYRKARAQMGIRVSDYGAISLWMCAYSIR
jgi:acyl-CoA dehydrogenase